MELRAYSTGEISIVRDGVELIRYPRTTANQLILCARMNDWDRFTAMWKKKTAEPVWSTLQSWFDVLETGSKWKIKETFARRATTDAQIPQNENPPERIPLA